MYHKNKGVFIVLNHTFNPIPNSKTEVTQQIEFLDRLKNRHYNSSTAIIELESKRLIKDRSGQHTFNSILAHVKEQYPEQLENLLEITGLKEKFSTRELPEEIAVEAQRVLDEIAEEKAAEAKTTKKKATKKKVAKKKAAKKES